MTTDIGPLIEYLTIDYLTCASGLASDVPPLLDKRSQRSLSQHWVFTAVDRDRRLLGFNLSYHMQTKKFTVMQP
ncbi:MAG: hypothetical protein AB4426_16395 [Xenococcaceae cyanobacterium]